MAEIQLNRDDPRHRALARLVLARHDVAAARSAAEHIVKTISSQNDPLFDALCCAVVTCYSRPFIGRRNYPGIPKRFSTFERDDLKTTHDRLIDFRNAFVAHRDQDLSEVTIIPKGTGITFNQTGARGTFTSHGDLVRSRVLTLESIPRIKQLLDVQLQRLKDAVAAEKERLFCQVSGIPGAEAIEGV